MTPILELFCQEKRQCEIICLRNLNPLDYSVWSILEAMACSKPHKNLKGLKLSLRREWGQMQKIGKTSYLSTIFVNKKTPLQQVV